MTYKRSAEIDVFWMSYDIATDAGMNHDRAVLYADTDSIFFDTFNAQTSTAIAIACVKNEAVKLSKIET